MFIEAVSFVEDKSRVPTKAGQGGGSKLSGSNSIVTCPIVRPGVPMVDEKSRQAWRFIDWITRPMETGEIGFSPSGVARGDDFHVLTGTQGEVVKIDREGMLIGPVVTPFPSPIVDSTIVGDRWCGMWMDRELRQARMAAIPLNEDWVDGPNREQLRISTHSTNGGFLKPAMSIWHRTLDSEPMKIGVSGENIVFTTVSGVYMIDSDANEIWRGMLPRWPDISSLFAFDQIVGIVEFPGGLSIWSRAGGVSVIDPSNGLEIFSGTIQFGDKISGVSYSEEGGWFVMLHEGSVAVMDKIEGDYSPYKTGSPVLDAQFIDGSWRWTGWRHDGSLTGQVVDIFQRDSVGVSIINGRVLTNDGSWSEWGATRQT